MANSKPSFNNSIQKDKFKTMKIVIDDLFEMFICMHQRKDLHPTAQTIYEYFNHSKIRLEMDKLFLTEALQRQSEELLKNYADKKMERNDAVHVIKFMKFACLVQEFNTNKNIASIVLDKFKKFHVYDCEWLENIVKGLLLGNELCCNIEY